MVAIFKDFGVTNSCPYLTNQELVKEQWRKAFGAAKFKSHNSTINEGNGSSEEQWCKAFGAITIQSHNSQINEGNGSSD